MKNKERAALMMEVIPRVMRLIRNEMRQQGKNKLTVPQFRVLNRVAREPASNQVLADWMGVSAPTMSRMIDTLIKRGLLTRKTEASDRRQVLVECTKKGLALAQEIRGAMHSQLTQKISLFPEEKLQAIEGGLLALKETLL
jgi:DNA-binding MarR family transcriptional regulator